MAEALLAELSTDGYRATADKLRRLATMARLPEARDELLMIAASFERLALREEGPYRTHRDSLRSEPRGWVVEREFAEAL